MAAKQGNKYAQKWDKANVTGYLTNIEAEAKKDTCLWLGTALVDVGLYRDVWAYWKKIFKKDEDVFRTIKRIEQIFENKLFVGGLKNELNPTLAIFGLKNNHEWRDKHETDLTSAGKSIAPPPSVNLSNATTEELEQLAKILANIGGGEAGARKA